MTQHSATKEGKTPADCFESSEGTSCAATESGRIAAPQAVEPAKQEQEPSIAKASIDPIAELRNEFKAGMAQLLASFDEKIRYDSSRETIIDRLHSELQEHKADLLLKVIKPLVLDLINLHDDVGKLVASHETSATDPVAAKLLGLLSGMQTDIENILYRNGFEALSTTTEDFDAKHQRAFQSIATADSALDRKIARRLRKGFVYQERIIRPEIVAVYTYKPGTPA